MTAIIKYFEPEWTYRVSEQMWTVFFFFSLEKIAFGAALSGTQSRLEHYISLKKMLYSEPVENSLPKIRTVYLP